MRALHTADWHIGQTLNGWSREAEHARFFAALTDLMVAERIDLLLVAGDIFDTTNPSGESQRLFYRTMAAMKARLPNLRIILTGGNHDPALRLEAPGDVLGSLDIHTIGTVLRKDGAVDLDRHLIPVPGPDGVPALYVLAIPFLRAADLSGLSFARDEGEDTVIEAARRFHAELTEAALPRVGDLPLIAMGHLHCTGGLEAEGAERRILIGGSHAVPPEIYPPRIDYVALGHLHGPQSLDGGRVRYSGSCFPLSASEIRYTHGVTILDIEGRDIRATHHAIPLPAPVLRLPATGTLTLAELEAALAEIAPVEDVNLRPLVYVELLAEEAPSVMMGRAEALLREAPVRPAGIRIHRAAEDSAEPPASAPSLGETSPEDLFARAFETKNGFAPEDRHLAAFRDVLAEV
ncbi:exonuclease SbcCD subunit D [Pseudooceanicola marinus]|uniref:exonuclease SbcCD subunit D n=1 Tax=Pseudooceanicola marinus TaxID=396013 RepID=UPI001CD3EF7F|nr:exonuclease SbcCD subunit D [Pseudooceanicola marinus]MCA1334428.1 exonuclease SbcCD subunit D [Pseudooceanicola marinus]